MKSQLTVYKASAGSGKTFTLAREYMTMVIDNPMAYRTILAVTFTNKATEEMKVRILGQLYGIAHQLPDSAQYLEQISAALPHLSIPQIVKNAEKALDLLIHNYNYFRVMTIDTFFQSVLRNLARELDLTANLRIGLNDQQVEQQAVDELIESLESTDKLLFWIMDYIKENISDDKNWNVIGQIKQFGLNIFRDYYKEQADALSDLMSQEGFFDEFKDKMKKIKAKAVDHFNSIASTFFDALEEGGFTYDDLAGKKKGIWSYFNKLSLGQYGDKELCNKTLADCIADPKKWVKQSDVKANSPIYECVGNTLHKLLVLSEENRPKLARMYKSAELTMRHLNQLRLLGSIDRKVRELNDDANRFLLSDTQTLLHSLIQNNDSPFIFEKIGTQLEHVMIDEFQDTSTIQWKNFKVLLEETMSREDAGNLIVGDVKQSIYRWRSGDWRLLNNIGEQFEGTHHDIDIETLDTNYRSDRNVVNFNNAFFVEAAQQEYDALKENTPVEAEQLKNAYADVEQKVPDSKPTQGYVEVKLLKTKNEEEGDRMMQLCLDTVNDLTSRGVPTNRIAILVRTNGQIQNIAEYFMNHSDYEMVSDEAFRLDASQAVNTLVAALRHLLHPDDAITKAALQKYIDQYLKEDESQAAEKSKTDDESQAAEKSQTDDESQAAGIQSPAAEKQSQDNDRYAASKMDFFSDNRQQLLETPLYDLVERIFQEMKMGEIDEMKQQSAYVCAFYDKLNAFLVDNSSDIESFLQEWDNELHKKSIHSDSEDGIRMLTIHKSKGLEYDTVIMPYCDWKLEKGNTIWCTPQEAPYNELPLAPVDFSAGMMLQSIYEPDYHREHLQNMVDNLNLLYVAFTRASHNLYVFGKRGKVGTRSNLIEKALPKVAEVLGTGDIPCQLEGIDQDAKTDDINFSYGEPVVSEEKKKKTSQNIFEQPSSPIQVNIHINAAMPEFRQSIKSRDFIEGDEEEEQQKYYIKMGTVLHALFSTIHTRNDIDGALKELELDGVLYDDNISRDKVEAMIRKRLESPKVSDWFSDRWKTFNECSILQVEDGVTTEHRPDRVMQDDKETIVVDFKFGKPKPQYHDQVKEYMDLLSSMGHKNVKGYLWYVYPNKIVEVDH